MAAREGFRDIQQIASASIQSPYTVATGLSSSLSVVSFTNTVTTPLNINLYHNDGSTDYLKATIHLPGGIGREEQYYGFERAVMKAGDVLKVTADAATAFNLFIYGSEVSV